jgi:FixJ family two-component response regulator
VTEFGTVVFLVGDDALMRDALDGLLSRGQAVCRFQSASEFLARPRSSFPACLVLDVNLPGSLNLQQELAVSDPMPIVFISGNSDIPTCVRAMKAGAFEFLAKPFCSEQLIAAVEEGLERARKSWDTRVDLLSLRSRFELLTRREREVLMLVVAGAPNKHIAHELGITEVTVKGHRGRMMRKLCASSIAELVRMASALAPCLPSLVREPHDTMRTRKRNDQPGSEMTTI